MTEPRESPDVDLREAAWQEPAARRAPGGPLMLVSDPGEELHTPEYERRIAETLADRRPSRKDVLERAERREEMVRAAAGEAYHVWLFGGAEPERVVEFVDRLLAELDRRRDAEAREARS